MTVRLKILVMEMDFCYEFAKENFGEVKDIINFIQGFDNGIFLNRVNTGTECDFCDFNATYLTFDFMWNILKELRQKCIDYLTEHEIFVGEDVMGNPIFENNKVDIEWFNLKE